MGFGSKCSIFNGQVINVESSKLNIADMWLIPLDRVTNCSLDLMGVAICFFNRPACNMPLKPDLGFVQVRFLQDVHRISAWNKCDPSQQNRHLSHSKKMRYPFYLKEHFISSKRMLLMCKLDAALQFYGQKYILLSFYFLCFLPHKCINILKCIQPTSALFWCDGSQISVAQASNHANTTESLTMCSQGVVSRGCERPGGNEYLHIWLNRDGPLYWVAFLQEILKHGSHFLPKKSFDMGKLFWLSPNFPENYKIFEKWAYFSRKILKNGFRAKSPLKMGRSFEAQAAHPCLTQIWVPPVKGINLF